MKILITGVAGFIGFNLCKHLLTKNKKNSVIGIDCENNYYSVFLKKQRIKDLKKNKKFRYVKINLSEKKKIDNIFKKNNIDCVIHLAAQAGVRYSVINPNAYIQSNVNGFSNIIESSKNYNVKNFIYASSSSVYGDNKNFPLKENQSLNPLNLYGLTKKFNEDMASLFFKNYKFSSIGLRFFTVFGEWGRPDMFLFKYLSAYANKKFFFLNNRGKHFRDFTYIDDVVDIIERLINKKNNSNVIYNISSNKPLGLLKIIKILDKVIKKRPKIVLAERQSADIIKTHGNNKKIIKKLKIGKLSNIEDSLIKTSKWFLNNKKLY